MATTEIRIESITRPTTAEWHDLGRAVDAHLIATLEDLSEEEWDRPTVCEPWRVRDVVAHLLGWGDAVVSPKELARQTVAGYRNRKAHAGNALDAQNQFQVDEHAALTTSELLERFRAVTPRFHKGKRRLAGIGQVIPLKENFSGTWVNLGYAMTTIFARDHFMHHVDICQATGRTFEPTEAEARIVHDAIREWAGKAQPDVRLELSGPAGGTFVTGAASTTIKGDAIDFARVIAGRHCDLEIQGDAGAAARWLATPAVF